MTDPARATSDPASTDYSRILLIKPSSLGDVIHALPVLERLRSRYPQARIDWLIATACAPLLAGHSGVDQFMEFDRKRLGKAWWHPGAAGDLCRFMIGLRRPRYELVIDLQGLIRTAWFGFVTGAPTRVGFADAREGAPRFYTHLLPGGKGDWHAVDRNLQINALLELAPGPVRFPLEPREVDRAAARELISSLSSPLVAVAPGARWETKCWPPEHFAELIDRLGAERPNASFVLLGGPDETALCADIARRCAVPTRHLAGRTQLPVLVAVIEQADLVVCQDSAAAHLAAALGRPLVCITGPTNPLRTGPYGRLDDVVRLDLDCAPCYLRRLSQCPHNHRCMRELDVDRVLQQARSALGAAEPHTIDVD